MSGGTRPLPPAEAALAMLLAPSPAGKAGNAEAQLQLLRRLQEFPESFLPPAQQQQHCRHHPHPHCQEVEGQGTPADWQATQKLITALLSLVSSPSATSTSSSSSPPANLELRVHATLALTTLLVLSHPPASVGSSHDGDDDRRAAAPALARVLSHAASTLLQLVASSQHQQKRQQQKRGGAERGAVAPAPLRRVALEGLVELEAAFPGLLWEEREQLKAPAAGTTVGVAALLALVLANGTAAGVGGITRSGSDAAPATGAETRASMAAVLDRLPLLSPPRQLLAARRLAAAASAARVPPVVFKPQLLRLMASREPPLVAAALLMKRAFGDALFAPDEEALLARRLAVAAAHPGAGAGAADGARLLASRWLLRFPENSPLHDDDDDTGCCECRGGGVGSDAGGGGGVGPDCSAGGGVDGHGGDAAGRDAAGGGDGAGACGGRCHGAAGGRGGTERAPLSLTPAVATSLFSTVFQGCPPLSPSSSRQDGACTASLLLSRFQLLCLIHCEDDFGEAHGGSGAGEGADRLLGCLRAMASDLPRRSRQRRQQQQNKRQQQKRHQQQQQRSVPCPFFGAALLYFRHFRQNAPALRGLRQLLLDAFLEDVRLAPRLVRLVDRMQQHEEEEEAAEALAAATALESSSSSTSSSTSSLTSASPPSPASPGGGGDGFPVLLLRSLQEAIVGATSGSRSQPPRRPLERLPYELPVLERAAREPRVPAAPTLLFLLRLVSPADDAGPAAGVLGDWAGGCGILAVCRHLLARPGGGAADAVARPLLSRLLLALARSPLCDVDVRDRAGALAGLQAALSPAKLRALLAVPAAAAASAAARCGRHRHHDHHHDAAVPVPASPIAEVPCLVPLAEPALALALVDPDRDGGDGDVAGAGGDGDINEDAALPVYLGWLRGDKNGGAGGSERWGRPDEAPVGLRVALRDDWSRRHGRAYAVQLHFVGARAEDVRLPYLGPAGGGGAVVTARLRPSWSRGSGRRYRDVTLAPTAVFADGTGRTCRCRLPALPVPLTSLLRPLAPALSPGARSRLFEELWALFTTAAASDGSRVSDHDDDDADAVDPAACAQSVLRLGGGAGSEDGAVAERLERGLRRFAVPACARGPAGRPAFRAAMMLPPGRHVLVRVDGARGPQGGGGGPVSVLVTVATDDWRLLPLIGSHLARVATVKGDGL
ncbi:unnamed protein product [Lampetra fluviatilis]